jgi:hypothetical protein
MQPISCNLGRLGSRLNLIFEPQNRQARHGALGLFLDQPADLMLGVQDGRGRRFVFPFSRRGQPLRYVELRLTPTSVTWTGVCVPLSIMVEVSFTAPFWPQDEPTSLWPGYIISWRVRPLHRIRWHPQTKPPKTVRLVFDLDRPGRRRPGNETAQRFGYRVPLVPAREDTILDSWPVNVATDRVAEARDWIGPVAGGWRLQNGMLCADVALAPGKPRAAPPLLWVGHTGSVVLEAGGRPARFRYRRYWPTIGAAVGFGAKHWRRLLRKSARFDSLVAGSALSPAAQRLFAQSLQGFFMNTWWCDRDDEAGEWFSVWEGNCLFHSTVDVEYNAAMFYLMFWPRLLGLTLREWLAHMKPNPRGPGRYLDHDMGAGCLANGVAYGHVMGIEEASNYLLLLLAHARFNGDDALPAEDAVRRAARELAEYLVWTDQGGRGFPTEDVWNTIDDGCAAIQFGREQTYLAVKRLAALRAALALEVLERRRDARLRRQLQRAIALAKRSLRRLAWRGDHYAVCIDRSAARAVDPNTGRAAGRGEIEGWDDYHIYSSNGLLLLMMSGALTDLDLLAPMKQDLVAALQASLGPYGCSHNAGDPLNVWVSQNIWRDCIGHYLGAPIPDLPARYWDLQAWSNSGDQAKCFTDTWLNNNLSRYPRGIVCAGYFASLAGLVVNRARRSVLLRPLIRDGRLPLFPLADWKTGNVPALLARDGRFRITGRQTITAAGLRIAVRRGSH